MNSWGTGHTTWEGWVYHSWRFGQAEALREVGPKISERGLKSQRCQSPEQLLQFFPGDPNNFVSRLVIMDETWLYHYYPETKQQTMEWRHSGSPKIPSAKIRSKSSLLDFLGSRRHPPRWLSSKGSNNQRGVLLISAGVIEGHFEGKTPREGHQGGLVLARRFTGHLQPRIKWPAWAPTVLITHLILRIWPRRTTTCSLYWKNDWKVTNFSSDAEVIAAAGTWLDGQPSEFFFFSGFQKLERRT